LRGGAGTGNGFVCGSGAITTRKPISQFLASGGAPMRFAERK